MRRRFSIDNRNVNYMAIEALEDGLTATISGGLSSNSKIEYSIDGVDWVNMEIDVATSPINCGEKLLFKGNYLGNGSDYIVFSISKKCNLKGDIKTLWYGDNAGRYKTALYAKLLFSDCTTIQHVDNYFLSAVELTDYCYYDLFRGCTSLVNAPELPATTLARQCYSGMFYGCTSLTTVPATLPATTLDRGCYEYMFSYCESLTAAPELPATTLAGDCYKEMFSGCTKLNYIKMLATDISASYCLTNWVYNVASSGTFVKNPAMTSLPTGTSGISYSWRVLNSVTTPENQLKSFTIRETSTNTVYGPYKFEEGMTIDDFYESECNLDWNIIVTTGAYGVSFNGGNYDIFSWGEILQEQEYTFNYKTTGGEPM